MFQMSLITCINIRVKWLSFPYSIKINLKYHIFDSIKYILKNCLSTRYAQSLFQWLYTRNINSLIDIFPPSKSLFFTISYFFSEKIPLAIERDGAEPMKSQQDENKNIFL